MPTDVSPHQRHREANAAVPRCYLRDRGNCFGALESDHVLEVRWLAQEWHQKRVARAAGRIADHPLLHVELGDVIADGRNGGFLCGKHNRDKAVAAIGVEAHELPPTVREFAAEYDLEHLVERLAAR